MLAAYSYELKYRPGLSIQNADCSSRLPLPVSEHTVEQPADVFMLETAYPKVMMLSVVAEATSKDPILAKVREALWAGKELREPALKLYAHRSTQMSVQENCILLGSRVVVPSTLQLQVLHLLHEGHPGISKIKVVARSHVWWSILDDIANTVCQCRMCQENQRTARLVGTTPLPFPERQWS